MRTIIAGSRGITNADTVALAVEESNFNPSVVISGTARGIDQLGEEWATVHNIPIERYPADWKLYGRAAGHIRNEVMASGAEALVAIWDGESKGTKNMIGLAQKHKLKVFILMAEKDKEPSSPPPTIRGL
jgi:hypothetical protein